jgi:hypothetical protein
MSHMRRFCRGCKQAAIASVQRQNGRVEWAGRHLIARDQSYFELQHHHSAALSRIPQVLRPREADSWLLVLTSEIRRLVCGKPGTGIGRAWYAGQRVKGRYQ